MITFLLLLIISIIVLAVAVFLISMGGSLLLILGADIIVAVGFVWLLFKLFKKKK